MQLRTLFILLLSNVLVQADEISTENEQRQVTNDFVFPDPPLVWMDYPAGRGDGFLISPNMTWGLNCLGAFHDDDVNLNQECVSNCFDLCLTSSSVAYPSVNDLGNDTDSFSQIKACIFSDQLQKCWIPYGLKSFTRMFDYNYCWTSDNIIGGNLQPRPGYLTVVDPAMVTHAHLTVTHSSQDCPNGSEFTFTRLVQSDAASGAPIACQDQTNSRQPKPGEPSYKLLSQLVADQMSVIDMTDIFRDLQTYYRRYEQSGVNDVNLNFIFNMVSNGCKFDQTLPDTSAAESLLEGTPPYFETVEWLHGINASCTVADNCNDCHHRGCDWCHRRRQLTNADLMLFEKMVIGNTSPGQQPELSACGLPQSYCLAVDGYPYKANGVCPPGYSRRHR